MYVLNILSLYIYIYIYIISYFHLSASVLSVIYFINVCSDSKSLSLRNVTSICKQ